MSSPPTDPTIQALVGPDKESPETRYNCGVRIGATAPKSDLYQTVTEVQVATDAVLAETANLKDAMDGLFKAEAALALARTTLGTGVVRFDLVLNVFNSVAEKHCPTEAAGVALGVVARQGIRNALSMPLSVEVKYNPRKDWIYLHVHRAPGTSSLRVEMSLDRTTWTELAGDGAIHTLPNPDPGTYWFRALSQSARAKSDYTTPVSVIVR